MRVSLRIDRTVRLKVTNKCNLACHYCHHEGQFEDDWYWDDIIKNEIINLFNILKISRIHITGGEPTLYPNLKVIVRDLSKYYKIGLTTNGQCSLKCLLDLIENGLNDLTISILTFDPIEFKRTQLTNSYRFDQNKLINNIVYIKKLGIPIDINIPFSPFVSNESRLDIIEFAVDNGIDINFLDLIGDLQRTQKIITDIVQTLDIKPVEEIRYVNSSKGMKVFEFKNGTRVNIKLLNKFYLKSLCDACEVRDKCDEKYYGLRLVSIKKEVKICPCLQKNLVFSVKEFYNSDIFHEIINTLRGKTC